MDYSSISWGSGMPISWYEDDKNNQSEYNDKISTLKPVCVLKGHTNDVTGVDLFSRNLLATSSTDKTVRVYKWLPGDQFEEVSKSPLKDHKYGVNCVSFSPHGSKLASGSTDGHTIIWDIKSGENMMELKLPGRTISAVRTCVFSANSALLAAGGDADSASIWDVSNLSVARELTGHTATVTSVAFTPDSSCLATGSADGEMKLWDAAFGHALPLASKVETHDLGICSLHFNPAIGREGNQISGARYLLASGGQDTDLNLWIVTLGGSQPAKAVKGSSSRPFGDQESGRFDLHHTLCGHKAPIMMVKFGPSGLHIASASGDKTVRVWDSVRLRPMYVLEGHTRYVTSVAFSEDGDLVASGSGDRQVLVWRLRQSHPTDGVSGAVAKRKLTTALLRTYNKPHVDRSPVVSSWSVSDVCEWLSEEGLGEYAPNFRSQRVDGKTLLSLTEDDLEAKLGVDALGHRNRICRYVKSHKSSCPSAPSASDLLKVQDTPLEFICPITQEVMSDPVLCADGFSYEREAIEAWLSSGKDSSPLTNAPLSSNVLTPNRTLRNLIRRHVEAKA